jgi:CubicO group peptidase (beta-lactamase class C family)
MRRMNRLLLITVLAALALIGCEQSAGPAAMNGSLARDVRLRFDDAARDGFSGTALVIVGGETLLERGYGLADRDAERPNALGTAFDFGSVMKDLTAAAVFKLEAEGALSTADTLADVFDDVPDDKAEITILQLVQHSAGFDEYHDTEGDFEAMTRLEARERIFAQPLLFEPGDDESYSNTGYTLLADIIEARSERDFTDYVRSELLAPAGMASSGFYGDEVWREVDTAIGYDAETFEDNDPASWPLTWALVGNGGLVASVPDIARWLVAVRDGSVLNESALEAYAREYLEPSAVELEGKAVYAFAGAGDYGLGGLAIDCPELDARIVIATNTYTAFDIESFAMELVTLVLAEAD